MGVVLSVRCCYKLPYQVNLSKRMNKKPYPTIKAQTSVSTMVKPGELVDIVETTPLTLADRRIYNLLIENAWDKIDQPVEHLIAKRKLRGSHNVNFRVNESIERLMATIIQIRVTKTGEPAIKRIQLLGSNVEHERHDGMLYYKFPNELREIIKESRVFARLQKDVMFAFTSKYALALYEMVQKRGNLREKFYEDFTIEEMRGLLGVPRGKLPRVANLFQSAIKPAVKEVTALSDYGVKIEPITEGRRVVKLRLNWWKKDINGLKKAFAELQRCKVGRKARINGTVEPITD